MLSIVGDIWNGCTYIYTSDWTGSCSEEGLLFEGATPKPLYLEPYLTDTIVERSARRARAETAHFLRNQTKETSKK